MKRGNNYIIFCMLFVIAILLYVNKKGTPDLHPINKLPYFSYATQSNTLFTTAQLNGKVTVSDFFFTQCEGPCPVMNRYMKELVEKFSENNVQFISFSVDPSYDTADIITKYIKSRNLEYDNWFFLQTEHNSIGQLLENGFLLSGEGLPGMHSTKFILIDSNANVVGFYDPFIQSEFSMLEDHIEILLGKI